MDLKKHTVTWENVLGPRILSKLQIILFGVVNRTDEKTKLYDKVGLPSCDTHLVNKISGKAPEVIVFFLDGSRSVKANP